MLRRGDERERGVCVWVWREKKKGAEKRERERESVCLVRGCNLIVDC